MPFLGTWRVSACLQPRELLGFVVGPQESGSVPYRSAATREFFHVLNTVRYSDSLIPVAAKSLDSSNLTVASQAAIFLGQHGSGAVQDTLWQRLNALWTLWHDHGVELRGPALPLDKSIQSQSAHLEQSLASALAHANNWKLTPAERDRLRDGCLTEQCQRIAEGKMSFGL